MWGSRLKASLHFHYSIYRHPSQDFTFHYAEVHADVMLSRLVSLCYWTLLSLGVAAVPSPQQLGTISILAVDNLVSEYWCIILPPLAL